MAIPAGGVYSGCKAAIEQFSACLAKELGDRGITVNTVAPGVTGTIESGIQHFDKLDILVNNAGLEKRADFEEVTEEDYDSVININLQGVFFATQVIVQHLIDSKRPGKMINISSVHEELPFPHFLLCQQRRRKNDDAKLRS